MSKINTKGFNHVIVLNLHHTMLRWDETEDIFCWRCFSNTNSEVNFETVSKFLEMEVLICHHLSLQDFKNLDSCLQFHLTPLHICNP